MTPIEWYYAKGDRQLGPVSAVQLKQMAVSGEIRPDDLVWREGMDNWAEARNVKGLFDAGARPAVDAAPKLGQSIPPVAPGAPAMPGVPGRTSLDRVQGPPLRHPFDMLLDAVRASVTGQFIEATTRVFTLCGHYGLYAAMALGLLFALVLGIKQNNFSVVLTGIVGVLILAVLQYTASRFCDALERLNRTTSGTISSMAFPDCFALLSMVFGLAALIASLVVGIQSKEYAEIISGLVIFILCQYMAFIALNPGVLSLSVAEETRAGEEAIGVISFLLKAWLRLVPVAFGVGVVYGTLMLLYACYLVFDEKAMATPEPAALLLGLDALLPKPLGRAASAASTIIRYAALPLVAYLGFLLYYLTVDVIRAILVVPGKLDKLGDKQPK